jgi:hypothetical protein
LASRKVFEGTAGTAKISQAPFNFTVDDIESISSSHIGYNEVGHGERTHSYENDVNATSFNLSSSDSEDNDLEDSRNFALSDSSDNEGHYLRDDVIMDSLASLSSDDDNDSPGRHDVWLNIDTIPSQSPSFGFTLNDESDFNSLSVIEDLDVSGLPGDMVNQEVFLRNLLGEEANEDQQFLLSDDERTEL